MQWQGLAVIALLLLATIASKIVKSHPRDLIFAIAALLTPLLLGIVPSKQICQALANPTMLSLFGLWTIANGALSAPKPGPKISPLPLLIEIFTAYLFYFAIKNTALGSMDSSPFAKFAPMVCTRIALSFCPSLLNSRAPPHCLCHFIFPRGLSLGRRNNRSFPDP